jgi:hypothetical protein
VGSFETFKEKFFEHNENFMSAKIFGNPSLINSYRDRSRFNTDLFPRFINDNSNLVIRDVLTLNSTSARPVLISKPELEILTGTNIPVDLYNNFKIAIQDSFKCLKKIKIEQPGVPDTIEKFLKNFKKGSRPFRKILERSDNSKIKLKQKNTVKTYFRLINLEIPEERNLEKLYRIWNLDFLPNKLREFSYKFRSNILGINTRVSHFNRDVNRHCTFCALKNKNPCPDETFLHLFFDCPETNKVLLDFLRNYCPELIVKNNDVKKKFFFIGMNWNTDSVDNLFLEVLALVIMHSIWDCKLRKQLPVLMKIVNDISFYIGNAKALRNIMRIGMDNNLHICRNWQAVFGGRDG